MVIEEGAHLQRYSLAFINKNLIPNQLIFWFNLSFKKWRADLGCLTGSAKTKSITRPCRHSALPPHFNYSRSPFKHLNRLVRVSSRDRCILNIQSHWTVENWNLQSPPSPRFSCDPWIVKTCLAVRYCSKSSVNHLRVKNSFSAMNARSKIDSGDKKVPQWLLYFIIPGYSWLQIGPFTLLMMAIHHQNRHMNARVESEILDVRHSWSR